MEIFKSNLKNVMKLDCCQENVDVNTDVSEVNEVMINKHKARRETFQNNISYSCSYMEDVTEKIQKFKTFNLFESDIENIKRILQDKKTIFEKNWKEKYDIMKKDFDFHVYKMEQSSRFREIENSFMNLKSYDGQRIATEKDFESMLENMLENIKLVKMKIEEMLSAVAKSQTLVPNNSDKIASELLMIDCQQKMLDVHGFAWS